MTGLPSKLIEDTREWMRRELLDHASSSPLTVMMASWLNLSLFPDDVLHRVLSLSLTASGPARRHQDVAIVGFHLSTKPDDEAAKVAFVDGVQWLIGRANFIAEGVASGLLLDWPSILGISSGITALDHEKRGKFQTWLGEVCVAAAETRQPDGFHRAVVSYARARLDSAKWTCPASWADFSAALCGIGSVPADEIDWAAVLQLAIDVEGCRCDQHRYLIRLAAIASMRKVGGATDLSTPSRTQLVGLVERIQHSFLRWPWEFKPRTRRESATVQRWDLQNEYHFQSLLWAVIKPAYPDLEEESYLPKTGQLQPRADLCLPSIKTVIEVKFWYGSDKVTRLIEEVAADHSLYLRSGSPYESLLVVVWDDHSRTEEHGELARGLKGLQGILGVIVIPRPARMDVSVVSGDPHP